MPWPAPARPRARPPTSGGRVARNPSAPTGRSSWVSGTARTSNPASRDRPEPRRPREQPAHVLVELGVHRPVGFVEHVREVHPHRRVVRVRVPGPLQVPQRAVRPVVPAVVGGRLERLRHRVRDEQRHPAGAAVLERRREHRPEVLLGRHVRDRVVHEHRVERPPQPHRTHVALDVLALGVEPPAHRQHLRRAIDEREPEVGLQVRRVVPAARTELQDLARLAARSPRRAAGGSPRPPRVLLRRREQRPPLGELAVEPRRARPR